MRLHLGRIPADVLSEIQPLISSDHVRVPGAIRTTIDRTAQTQVIELVDPILRELLPASIRDQSRHSDYAALNVYDAGDYFLPWHYDSHRQYAARRRRYSRMFVAALVGVGELCFRRNNPAMGSSRIFDVNEADIRFRMRPGDVVGWTRREERQHDLMHGGHFTERRVTLAIRYLSPSAVQRETHDTDTEETA